jgi:outer membrane biosynthesis protein TonB
MASRANSLAETDPESADELVGQVLEIDPGNTLGLNLRALRSDRKKEEFIGWCTAQARKLQATGDLEGAMAILQEGLSSYPNDARLNQLYSLLDRQVQGPKKTGLIEPQSTASARPAPPAPEKAREPETKTSMMELSGVAAPQTPKPAAPPAQPPQSPQAQPPAPPPQTAPVAAAPQPPAKVEPPKPQPPKPQPPRQPAAPAAGAAKKGAGLRLAAIAASLVVLAAGGWFVWQKFKSSAPQLVQVEIRTNPRGARISVNNQPRGESAATLQLAPGDYQASAELDGYQPAATSFKVALGQPVSLELALQPWKAAIRVSSEAEVTEASLAGKPLNPGAAGEYAIDGLDDGTYPLKIVSPKGEAGATLVIEGRSLPVLSGPPQAKNLTLLLIHAAGDRIAVYANSATSKAALDGQPSQPIPADGLSFPGVAAGPHQLTLEDKGAPRTIAFRTGGPPAVNVFLLVPSEADKGSILVVAGEDGAGVSINGRQYPLKTRAGQVNLGGLKPGTYKIAVAKDGFEAAPAQDVTVKQGEQTRIEFKLKPAARMASVRIQGPAGAQVLMDGQPVGVVGPDGVFSQDVSPGSHSFELKRGGEQSRQATQDFRAGETVRLGEELALRPANGAIRFDIVPAEASITIRRQGEPESAARPVTQNPASVAEGTYIVTASAPRHITSVMSVIVQGGGSATASMALRPVESAKSASAEAMGIENFDNPGAWSKDGDWRVRKGGKFVTFRPANTGGTFTFQIQLRKGKKLQWFFAFADTRNHVLFRLDRQSFSRALVANGKTTEMGRSDNPVPGAPEWELRITVEPDKIVHEIKEGGKWITLDTCRELGKDLTAGRFGFFIPEALIPGQDEYALRGFTFVPRGK